METSGSRRQLTIGEYAAATQLTAKALRLYDEQGLLRPERIDASTGYRYYGIEQVAAGRLIRVLRDMNLSLVQIAQILGAGPGLQHMLLRGFLHDAEQRWARERTAYQSALLMMRSGQAASPMAVEVLSVPARLIAVFTASCSRRDFVEHALRQRATELGRVHAMGVTTQSDNAFALIEPLTDEDGRVELLMAIEARDDGSLRGLTIRRSPRQRYAAVTVPPGGHADGFTACIDALFDWFDKQGLQTIGHPEVVLTTHDQEFGATVRWGIDSGEKA